MALLPRRRKKKEIETEKQIALVDQEERFHEDVTALHDDEKDQALDHVQREVESKVREAAKQSIQEVKMLEQGRCPECGGRLEQLLYTSICNGCGYSRRLSPETGKVLVHLNDGGTIECDKIFEVRQGAHLCVRDDVVVARIKDEAISYIEYLWTHDELNEIKQRRERERERPCDWCGTPSRADSEEARDVYAAVGMHQHRFGFCSEKCLQSFRKQYPARVHRDCYERDCAGCKECIKRFDTTGRKL